ncbi:hypothetical protein FRC07_004327, partial [Ceratobasidium sp. 392]
ALRSAAQCVDNTFAANSMHCHFLSNADSLSPVTYHVEQVREGRTYRTLMVKGIQSGRRIFLAVCSFQRPEFNQPSHSWPMPRDVPPPGQCPNQEDEFHKLAERPDTTAETRESLLAQSAQMKVFPVEVRVASSHRTEDGLTEDMFWMRLKATETHDEVFQKCVLAFLSDFNMQVLSTVARAVNLSRGAKPPHRLAMISSLEHSVWFYDDSVDCTEWMLFVMVCPIAGMGRGIVHGRIYTQQGRLVLMVTQEGVVRAEPEHSSEEQFAAKL